MSNLWRYDTILTSSEWATYVFSPCNSKYSFSYLATLSLHSCYYFVFNSATKNSTFVRHYFDSSETVAQAQKLRARSIIIVGPPEQNTYSFVLGSPSIVPTREALVKILPIDQRDRKFGSCNPPVAQHYISRTSRCANLSSARIIVRAKRSNISNLKY